DAYLAPQKRAKSPYIDRFRNILQQVAQYYSRDYFILKSIILNNMYGVDLMKEATEICKLRLLLTLIAQVTKAEDIELLPDIDFNIRAGNTLVGFTSKEEIHKTVEKDLGSLMISSETLTRIECKAKKIERAAANFRKLQMDLNLNHEDLATSKQQLL